VFVLAFLVAGTILPAGRADAGQPARSVEIVKEDDRWLLRRDGKAFYVKGAVGWHSYELLGRCGGNSVRTRATRDNLDRAWQAGLTVMANLPVRGQRNGLDWGDEEMVAEQQARVLRAVEELKSHPAVLLWAVGNELDWIPPGIPHHPALWQRLNDLALEIHEVDPHHPVMTVVGTGRFERKVKQIAAQCPDMDLLGINAYGDIRNVTQLARRFWPKPYVVTEWGPAGHWQVPRTRWRVPIEQTSTEKARAIYDRYTQVIRADTDHCLGSYVFLWGQKQETTHTWYGMFQDDLSTESVDVMQYLWSGAWPQNRAPAVLALDVIGFADEKAVYLEPSGRYEACVHCYDSDYDALTFNWDIRPEVEIPENSYAGGGEEPALPIPGLIREGSGARIQFTAPKEAGAYRLFVQVLDGRGHAGYANTPFFTGRDPDRR
jgi:hypothetical protein